MDAITRWYIPQGCCVVALVERFHGINPSDFTWCPAFSERSDERCDLDRLEEDSVDGSLLVGYRADRDQLSAVIRGPWKQETLMALNNFAVDAKPKPHRIFASRTGTASSTLFPANVQFPSLHCGIGALCQPRSL